MKYGVVGSLFEHVSFMVFARYFLPNHTLIEHTCSIKKSN